MTNMCHRGIYPGGVAALLAILLVRLQITQFRKLYTNIKNDKYLIGTRLVNFDPDAMRTAFTQTET